MTSNHGPPTLDALTAELREVTLQVHAAQDRHDERDVVTAAHQAVEELGARYRAFFATLGDLDKMRVERQLGRRLTDVKRLASLLPRTVTPGAASTPDRQVAGASTVGERRITGVSWAHERRQPRPGDPEVAVGGEVESWCGKCGEMTTHHVVAMVGTEPKQVICQVCNGRHAFRTAAPPRKSADGVAEAAEGSGRPRTPQDMEAARKAEQLRALAREVQDAVDARVFDPKGRYKAGEIIFHPDYGRGKIENVLRSSLLIRFPAGGLKSLMLT